MIRRRGAAATTFAAHGRSSVEQRRERLPFDELHRVVVHAVLFADREHRHDVRMLHLGRGLGLVLEAADLLRVVPGGERQDLQRDAPPQRNLLRLVDDAHAAAADLAHQPEVADRLRQLRHAAGQRNRRRRLRRDRRRVEQLAGRSGSRAGVGILADAARATLPG